MEIAIIIFLVPFCIPLLILILMSLYLNKQKELVAFSETIFKFSPFFWLLPLVTIPLLQKSYDTKSLGTLLTLLIPNIAFFFSYLPEFILSRHSLSRSLYNGIFAILSTLFYWNLTVRPTNWREGALAFVFIVPAMIVMIFMTSFLLKYRTKEQTFAFKKQLFVALALVAAIIAFKSYTHNFANRESSSKIQLIQAVIGFVTKENSEAFSQKALIDSGALNGIYEINNEIITNKYGGMVSLSLKGDDISIVYTQIPAKEPCFMMFFMNSPQVYGFDRIYVSGVQVPPSLSSTQDIESAKQKLCYSSSGLKEIEFRGSLQKLRERLHREKQLGQENSKASLPPNPQLTEKVFSQFSKLQIPDKNSNDFDHWKYAMALYTTVDCWKTLNPSAPLPEALLKAKLQKGGVWKSPSQKEIPKVCQSLADQGIKPLWTSSLVWGKGVTRQQGLPLDYIQIYELEPLQIEGSLGCYLTPDQIGKQEFFGQLSATWSEKPRLQRFNLANGARDLLAGTLMISSPDAPGFNGEAYKEPKTTVVIEKR